VTVANGCLHVDSRRAGEASCAAPGSGHPAGERDEEGVGKRGGLNAHRSRASCSIYHANAMLRALSVGLDARKLRPAWELRPNFVCTGVGDGRNPSCSHGLPYATAPAESRDGTAMIVDAPRSPIRNPSAEFGGRQTPKSEEPRKPGTGRKRVLLPSCLPQMVPSSAGWWVTPILGIPPVKAWREDSRGKAGFADCNEHAVGLPCFSARKPAGHEFQESTRSDPGQIRNAVQGL
jgi:hypothetical protein